MYFHLAFPKIKSEPPVEDINGNGKVVVVEIPGGMLEFEGKTRISKGESTSKKLISQGGLEFFFWQSPFMHKIFLFLFNYLG